MTVASLRTPLGCSDNAICRPLLPQGLVCVRQSTGTGWARAAFGCRVEVRILFQGNMNRLWFAICFLSLVCPTILGGTLDISYRLSTYQTYASDVIMYVKFKTDVAVPAGGLIEITTYGTTSTSPNCSPPGLCPRTAATILCVGDTESWGLGYQVQGYQVAPDCGSWVFGSDSASKGPYVITMPSGLQAGSYYGFAIGISALSSPVTYAPYGQGQQFYSAHAGCGTLGTNFFGGRDIEKHFPCLPRSSARVRRSLNCTIPCQKGGGVGGSPPTSKWCAIFRAWPRQDFQFQKYATLVPKCT